MEQIYPKSASSLPIAILNNLFLYLLKTLRHRATDPPLLIQNSSLVRHENLKTKQKTQEKNLFLEYIITFLELKYKVPRGYKINSPLAKPPSNSYKTLNYLN